MSRYSLSRGAGRARLDIFLRDRDIEFADRLVGLYGYETRSAAVRGALMLYISKIETLEKRFSIDPVAIQRIE